MVAEISEAEYVDVGAFFKSLRYYYSLKINESVLHGQANSSFAFSNPSQASVFKSWRTQ